jgi:hypothetical protein
MTEMPLHGTEQVVKTVPFVQPQIQQQNKHL